MEKEKLSVIVVCCNECSRIEKTLKSILMQTYEKMECIIIDGGSTDGTQDIIKAYQAKFIHSNIKVTMISEPDHGIYDAMNKGISKAEGEWVHFLNAGDCFHGSDAVRMSLACGDEGDEIIVGKIVFFDGYLGKLVEHRPLEELKKDMIFCHQAVFTHRELLQRHPFDMAYRYCADYEWLLSMYLEGKKIHCIDSIVADYDGGGVSSSHADASRTEMKQIQKDRGLLEDDITVQRVNCKYKLYKTIGKNKVLAWLFYNIFGKKRQYYFN